MRKPILIIITLLLSLYDILHAQTTLSGKISSTTSFAYDLYQPVHGYMNHYFVTQPIEGIMTKDSFHIHLNLDKPSFITLYFKDTTGSFLNRTQTLVMPGDSIHLEIDPYKRDEGWVKYTGSNAAGNNMYNLLNQLAVSKHQESLTLLNKIKSGYRGDIVAALDSISNNLLLPFVDLKNKKLISESYLKYMDTTFSLMTYAVPSLRLISSSKEINLIDKRWRDSIVQQLFNRLDPLNNSLSSLYASSNYLNLYYKYLAYKKLGLKNIEELNMAKDTLIDSKRIKLKGELTQFIYTPDLSHRQDLWALALLMGFTFSTGYYTMADIDFFNNSFPNSKWSTLLANHYEINKPVPKPVLTKADSANMIFLNLPEEGEHSDFKRLASKINQGPKKMIFVDVWASWCGPCIKSFQQNPKLDSLLNQLSIAKLYLSIDNGGYALNWQKAIYNYALKGFHYRADKELFSHLLPMLGMKNMNELSIPQYMLLDAQGKLIDASLPSPLAFSQLKKVLEEHSNK